jgi:hypothetical protein
LNLEVKMSQPTVRKIWFTVYPTHEAIYIFEFYFFMEGCDLIRPINHIVVQNVF